MNEMGTFRYKAPPRGPQAKPGWAPEGGVQGLSIQPLTGAGRSPALALA